MTTFIQKLKDANIVEFSLSYDEKYLYLTNVAEPDKDIMLVPEDVQELINFLQARLVQMQSARQG